MRTKTPYVGLEKTFQPKAITRISVDDGNSTIEPSEMLETAREQSREIFQSLIDKDVASVV